MMELVLQRATEVDGLPDVTAFTKWAEMALASMGVTVAGELVVRVVDEMESAELNQQYRHKSGATNVLSFPFEVPPGVPLEELPLGDLVVCAPVIQREAREQDKTEGAHWAHMVVHGVLHLLGLDHIDPQQAVVMEEKEVGILKQLGISNPYA
ncbi:MAG: rRNA maturation RNase YbeY [Gammaproteobacteria bacterium]|nr:rRNA maturation RNase YbeY [Gammaproteobacteria bacterium]MBT3488674.1 rRNA maturation RNase YbeY [Gammaproteobacteria bacterium]MBT3719050.1 rRNA maturation RNase YbeY [Gammaproteobacteria bacterium]MBT3844223.1 rRNA maturation RNase YbeY [Gammaproteobacteria bacterium]MBT3892348.1 rRNA maturation RNase YbeY [Gammaproteobacteria bacterium]